MTKTRIAFVIAGVLCGAQAGYAVDNTRGAVDASSPYAYQSSTATYGPGVSRNVYRDRTRAPMASESWDNPAYNASNIPDNFPWFGNDLIGQRPFPAEMAYFAQREAQLSGRTSNDLSQLPRSDDLRGQIPQGQYTYERDRGAAAAPRTMNCVDSFNRPMPC
jgi:hypothetical protein